MASDPTSVHDSTSNQKKGIQRKFGSLGTVFKDALGRQYLGEFLGTIENSDSFNFLVRIDNLNRKYEKTQSTGPALVPVPHPSELLPENYVTLNPVEDLVPLDPEDEPLIVELMDIYSGSIAEGAPKLENFPAVVMNLGKQYKKLVLDPLVESNSPFKLKKEWFKLYNTNITRFHDDILIPTVRSDSKELIFVTTEKRKFSIFGLVTYHVKDALKGSFTAFKSSKLSSQLVEKAYDASVPIDAIGSDPFLSLWPLIRDLRIQFHRYWIGIEACCDKDPTLSKVRISLPYQKVAGYYQSLTSSQDNYVDTKLNKNDFEEIERHIQTLSQMVNEKTNAEATMLLLKSLKTLRDRTAELKSKTVTAKTLPKLEKTMARRVSDSSAFPSTSPDGYEGNDVLSVSRKPASKSPHHSPPASPKKSPDLNERYLQARQALSDRPNRPLTLRPSSREIAKNKSGGTQSSSQAPLLMRTLEINVGEQTESKSSKKIDDKTIHASSKNGSRSYSVPSPKGKGKQMPSLVNNSPKRSFFS